MALTKVPSNLDSITATTQSASDNSTNVATTAYVTTAVSNLVDGAPSTLNTLNEIAAALNDDASLSSTLTTSIADKLPLGGGTLVGTLTLSYDYPRINLTDTNHDSDYSIINNNGEFGVYDVTNAAYRLQINSSGNLTVSGHITASGTNNIYVGDNGKFTAGGGDDLQIYHDGTNSHIYNNTGYTTLRTAANNGYLYLHGDNVHLRGQTANETLLTAVLNGAVKLYYDNSEKLATTTNGVDVAGNIALTNSDNKSLRINSSTSNAGYLAVYQDQAIFSINRDGKDGGFADTSKAAAVIKLNSAAADSNIEFQTTTTNNASPTTRLTIDKNGHVTLPGTSVIAGATIRSSGINASNSHLQLDNAHPWLDLVAPDGSYFKGGITARGGASSTQAQFHLHITRDSSYRKLSTAGNYDTYLVTETVNTAYGDLIFGTDLTEAMRISASNQYVGIGETSPDKQLHIKNTATGDTGIVIENTNNAQNLDIDFYNNVGSAQGRIRYAEGAGSFSLEPNVSDNNAFNILYNGVVDITGTMSQDIPNSTNTNLWLVDTNSVAAGIGGSIVFGGNYTGTTSLANGPYIKAYKTNATDGDYGFGLKLAVRKMSSSQLVAMELTSDADIVFPEGNIYLTGSNDRRIKLSDSGISGASDSNNTVHIRGDNDFMKLNAAGNGGIIFEVDGSEHMRIDSVGNLFYKNAPGSTAGNPTLKINTGTGYVYYDSSSLRYKENVQDFPSALAKVNQLRPVTYDDKATGEASLGLIAEEVVEITPELVTYKEIDGSLQPETVVYDRLTIHLLKAIQEQQEQIETLKQEVEELKGG